GASGTPQGRLSVMRGEDLPPCGYRAGGALPDTGAEVPDGPGAGGEAGSRAGSAWLEADGRVEFADFPGRQRPGAAGPEVAECDRADAGADQAADRVASLHQQPPDDVLAPLVQGDLDQRPRSSLLDDPELVCAGDAVLELDPGDQPPPQIPGQRRGDVRQIGLGHAVPRVGQAMSQLPVVGQQHEPFGVVVEPADVDQPLRPVPQEIADGGPATIVRYGG